MPRKQDDKTTVPEQVLAPCQPGRKRRFTAPEAATQTPQDDAPAEGEKGSDE
jgi:hypothetical protein